MSKVSEQLLQEQQDAFAFEFSYQEWLRDNISEVSEAELNEMALTMCTSSNTQGVKHEH